MEKNIVLITDLNYAMPTCVTVNSILQNNNDINIYIISSNLEEKDKQRMISLSQSVHIVDSNNLNITIDSQIIANTHVSKVALLKFKLAEIFDTFDTILYMDTDIVVDGSLDEIFDIELKDNYCAAVRDYGVIWQRSEYPISNEVDLYFNSGVMLLNLKKMREDNIEKKLFDTKIKRFSNKNIMDQDTLNTVFNKFVFELPLKYNYVNDLETMGKNMQQYISREMVLKDGMHEKIIVYHYASYRKPWKYINVPNVEIWEKYFEKDFIFTYDINNREKLMNRWYQLPVKIYYNIKKSGIKRTFSIIKKVILRKHSISSSKKENHM